MKIKITPLRRSKHSPCIVSRRKRLANADLYDLSAGDGSPSRVHAVDLSHQLMTPLTPNLAVD
jgi:hypothetical protein